MVRASSWQVFSALKTAGLTASIVDDLSDICYFPSSIVEVSVRAVLDPLEWTDTVLLVLSEIDPADPYPQYLNTTRHDEILRHTLGSIVPQDVSKTDNSAIDTDGTLAANSDMKIPSQKAVKTYAEPVITTKNTAFNKNYGTTATDVKVNGTQAVGSIDEIARIDHIHPTDTSRAATSQKLDDFGTPDDNTDLNANTTNHGLLLKATAPASGNLNVVGIANSETSYANKTLYDTTNPEMDGTAAPGSSLYSARRDHVHPTDTSRASSGHNHDGTYCRYRGASASEPGTPIAGDIWIDTSGTPTPKIYSGSTWISLI